jgi:hypothetical protein
MKIDYRRATQLSPSEVEDLGKVRPGVWILYPKFRFVEESMTNFPKCKSHVHPMGGKQRQKLLVSQINLPWVHTG